MIKFLLVKMTLNIASAMKMLFLPKISPYRKYFDETKYMSFLIKDKLLEKYNEIWRKAKSSIKKEFDIEPIYNEKYLKPKLKSFNGKTITNFHNNRILKEGSQFVCLSVISIDFLFVTHKTHYLQVSLEECKNVVKGKRCLSILLI